MYESPFARYRRRIGWGMSALFACFLLWSVTPGMPVVFAPRASAKVKAVGLTLFRHEWQPHDPMANAKGDGLGPVFNARSCVECHSQGGVGGGGDNRHNVLAFEALPTQDRPDVKGGLIHRYAVENHFLEGEKSIHDFFPIIPGGLRLEGGCQVLIRDFDPVHKQSVNSTALFGAGWVDRISSKTIWVEGMKSGVAKATKELNGDFSGTVPGRARVLADGRVGKFGWKAQFATLEEFVAAACANEIGLGNPRMEQAKPMVHWNYPAVEPDLTGTQFRALVAFVDTLPRPVEVLPSEPNELKKVERGKEVFHSVGCALCHTPDLGGVTGVYSDFLLHRIDDSSRAGGGYRERPPVPLPHDFPLPEEWKTPPLWGVADSAPYFHDGGSGTLEDAIVRHRGDAEPVALAFQKLTQQDRILLIRFLKSLKAPADAEPVTPASQGRLAMAR